MKFSEELFNCGPYVSLNSIQLRLCNIFCIHTFLVVSFSQIMSLFHANHTPFLHISATFQSKFMRCYGSRKEFVRNNVHNKSCQHSFMPMLESSHFSEFMCAKRDKIFVGKRASFDFVSVSQLDSQYRKCIHFCLTV